MLVLVPEKFGLNKQQVWSDKDKKHVEVSRPVWINVSQIQSVIPTIFENEDGTRMYSINIYTANTQLYGMSMSEDLVNELIDYLNYEMWKAERKIGGLDK